ncbi:hypothetical protein [Pedobacter sp. UBA5917]|jgi:hypothetical protein|uniref:hypothetical protein n=1 Tax=Pedobacter sp. UBA5917 TaxID=1947061 RepID=UPI0025D2C040|nr:hypothetical protein [Pedobacter sp. UBA5917]
MIFDFIKRRYIALILLLPYFGLWYLCISSFHTPANPLKKSCGAANAGMLLLMLAAIAFTSIIFLVFILTHKGQQRKDFTALLLLTYFPLVIAIADILT